MGDRVAVRRAEYQGLKDQHVQGPLGHFALKGGFASWHERKDTSLDYRPVKKICFRDYCV
jgi:hypothetical protein